MKATKLVIGASMLIALAAAAAPTASASGIADCAEPGVLLTVPGDEQPSFDDCAQSQHMNCEDRIQVDITAITYVTCLLLGA